MEKINFEDLPSEKTPINAKNLNKVQDNVEDAINEAKLTLDEYFNNSMGDIIVDSIRSKNMLDIYSSEQGYINNTGVNATDTSNYRSTDYIEVNPKTSYTFSANTTLFAIRINEYDSNYNHIKQTTVSNMNSYTIITVDTTKYIRWSINYNRAVLTQAILQSLDLMFEKGDVATSYIPFKNYGVKFGGDNNTMWLKFDNGIMICSGKGEFQCNYVAWQNFYRSNIDTPFTFPQKFIAEPVITCNTTNNEDYTYGLVYGLVRTSEKIENITLLRPMEGSGMATISYIAIGFWK